MWDSRYVSQSDDGQSISWSQAGDKDQDKSDAQSIDSSIFSTAFCQRAEVKKRRPLACTFLAISLICILGGSGYYLAIHVFDVFGETQVESEQLESTTSTSTSSVSLFDSTATSKNSGYNFSLPTYDRTSKICVSIESESPPPSPCIECIVRDAFNKKSRRLSLGAVFRDPEQTESNITNTTNTTTIANTTTDTSFLEILQEFGNSELQNITSIAAFIDEPATYVTLCPEEESLVALDDCVIIPDTCPSREDFPAFADPVNPKKLCKEVAQLNVEMLTEGWRVTDTTSDGTIKLYENLVLEFLQLELDAQCQLSLLDNELCTDEGAFEISTQNFTNVSVMEGDECSSQ